MMEVTVRKIPVEQLMSVLIKMRDSGEEFVNFHCEMSPTQDNVHIEPYSQYDSKEMTLIELRQESEDQVKTIKRLLDNGSKRD